MKQIKAIASLIGWDEKTEMEWNNAGKVNIVETGFKYTGDINAESKIRYLLQYNEDGTGSYIGWEYLKGQIGDRSGSILLRHDGLFFEHGIQVHIETVKNSCAEGFTGIMLQAQWELKGQGPYEIEFAFTEET